MSILLNSSSSPASHAFYLSPPTQTHRALSSASSSSTDSEIQTETSKQRHNSTGSSLNRKIRFAPLPDPRKLDEFDNGSVTSLSESGLDEPVDALTNSRCASPSKPMFDLSCLDKSDKGSAPSSLRSVQSNRTAGWTKKLFAPLLPKSSSRNNNNDDSSGLGSLFRSTSRESVRSTQSASTDATSTRGLSLSRRFSTGSSSLVPNFRSDRDAILSRTSPLTPSISEGGASTRARRGPQTMLNGRVYGRHRGALTPDPFQNQRPAHEPEFVEWGYGGMGSVPSAKGTGHAPAKSAAAADWARLQSGNKVFGSAGNQDDDDGSGMGWVKRRREQREREAKEKEQATAEAARLKQESELAEQGSAKSTTTPPAAMVTEAEATAPVDDDATEPPSPEHKYSAVMIPAPPHYHELLTAQKQLSNSNTPTLSRTSTVDAANYPPKLHIQTSDHESSNSGSSTVDEDDGEEADNDDDEDDDDDDDDEANKRMTSRCAGVEKISRHKEHHDDVKG